MVTEQIFNLVFGWFLTIREVLELITLNFGGVTINLWQFSLAIIVFGVIMGLFINYTKKEAPSDMANSKAKYDRKRKGD